MTVLYNKTKKNSHDTLITGTGVFEVSVVKTLGDFSRLLLNGNEDVTGLVVETLVRVVVTDLLDGISDNRLVIDRTLEGDLTEDLNVSVPTGRRGVAYHDHTGLGSGFTSNSGKGVLYISGNLIFTQKDIQQRDKHRG